MCENISPVVCKAVIWMGYSTTFFIGDPAFLLAQYLIIWNSIPTAFTISKLVLMMTLGHLGVRLNVLFLGEK